MKVETIVAISILGGLWFLGVCIYVCAWIKTKTWPFQLSDDELFSKAFGKGDDNEMP